MFWYYIYLFIWHDQINEEINTTYKYDDESDGDSDATSGDVVAVDTAQPPRKAKKSAFDKLYNDSSSSEEEGGNLLDYM